MPSDDATSLLRVGGKSPWRRATSTPPILRIDKSGDAHRFEALPASDEPRGWLRAAYSVPTNLIAADSKYWLEHPDGSQTELPQPVTGPGRASGDSAAADEHAEYAGDTALERELTALRSGRASLEQELDQSRDQLRIMTLERDELSRQAAAFDGVAVKARERAGKAEAANEQLRDTISELEVWRGELERRLAAISSELGVAKAAREADARERKRLHEALADADSRSEREGQSAEVSQTLAAQAAEIELLVAELAALRAEHSKPEGSPPEQLSEQAAARIARLEAERAELAHRAERLSAALQEALGPAQALLELARSGLDDERPPAGIESDAPTDTDTELISSSAERAAREQAERELREATQGYSRGRTAGG